MIPEFLDTWSLFRDAYLSGLLIAAVLGLVGAAVVARDQIFLGAAVSQASMFGIALGIRLSDLYVERLSERALDVIHSLTGGLFAVLGSLLTSRAAGTDTRESLTGWVFLVGASLSVLVVAHSPHGLAEVNRLATSTILGAHETDVRIFAVMLAISVAIVALRRDALMLMILDPEMARAVGIPVARWDRRLGIWLGITVAFSMHVSGLLYTFGCLVLPGLVARNVCRNASSVLVAAPLIGSLAALLSFVLANSLDYPPGQLAVAVMGVLLAASWFQRIARREIAPVHGRA